ncbi:MAG TPA: ATP-binding protein [Kofleriaceae bacterium]|nr:ATP-binding protein [Kofleriaceae bacterium]
MGAHWSMGRGDSRDDKQLIEAVAAGIAHEVRNPLNALQINLQILDQELRALLPPGSAHIYAVLGKISREVSNLDNFVSEFLRYARPPRLKIEQVTVGQVLGDLVTFLGPQFADRQVDLRLTAGGGPRVIQADSFQLKLALLNLLLNALQATSPGGSVEIATAGAGNQLSVEIRDSGEGVAPEQIERVFDVFFTTREGGTGLGLPIARRIIDEHGGSLTLESAPGRGTVARVLLPGPGD